ncbi:MAG: tetratricopeptide repeat protein, partial [Cytophagales bacterium]
ELAIQYLPNATYIKSLYFNRGLAYQKIKKDREALQDYTQVLQIEPDHTKALINRGIIKYQQKQIRPACQDWIRAKKLGNQKAEKNVKKACQCCI